MSTVLIKVCRIVGLTFAWLALLIGILYFIDLGLHAGKTVNPWVGKVSMKFNTAVCITILGIFFIYKHNKTNIYKLIYLLFIPVAIAIGSLIEDLCNINIGIDEFFVTDHSDTILQYTHPGRLSPLTAIVVLLLITATVIGRQKKLIYKEVSQLILGFITICSFIIITGYLFGVTPLQHFNFATPVPFLTATSLFLLSISAALLQPECGYLTLFVGDKLGNFVVRRLLLQIIIISLVLGYLRLWVYRLDLIEPEMALCITVLTFILCVSILVSHVAIKLNNIEKSRLHAEDKFKLIFDTTPNGLIMIDNQGKIILANNQCEDLFGYQKEDLVGKNIEILIPAKIRENHESYRNTYIEKPLQRTMGSGKDLKALNKNGQEIPVEIGLNSINLDKNKLVVASIIDITERKKQQKFILEQNVLLKQKNKEIEQFAYIASHDLREPLRTVQNYVTMVKEDFAELPAEVLFSLNSIEEATIRMNKLIKHLLDYGKIGSKAEKKAVNLELLVSNTVADLDSLIVSNSAQIIKVDALPEIMGYETELRQLFQNLIHNAIKFTQPGDIPVVEIYTEKDTANENVIFCVKDNGIGIEKNEQKKIFKIFYKSHNNQDGYGVGLANCLKIVALHQGKIWVESFPNEGTIFKFTLGI